MYLTDSQEWQGRKSRPQDWYQCFSLEGEVQRLIDEKGSASVRGTLIVQQRFNLCGEVLVEKMLEKTS